MALKFKDIEKVTASITFNGNDYRYYAYNPPIVWGKTGTLQTSWRNDLLKKPMMIIAISHKSLADRCLATLDQVTNFLRASLVVPQTAELFAIQQSPTQAVILFYYKDDAFPPTQNDYDVLPICNLEEILP